MVSLIVALGRVGLTPCEKHECPKRSECAENRLACASYANYVLAGTAYSPNYTYTRDAKGRMKVTGKTDDPEPTRQWYA